MMAVGIFPMPYGYYNLSRLVVCGCAIFFALALHKRSDVIFAWIFGGLAILYNPIVPIHLYEKEIWMVANAVTAFLFFIKRYVLQHNEKR